MRISEVVDRLKKEFPALSISKVRYLESEGLIFPHRVGNGYRRYSVADLERLRFALTAQREEYLPLSVIRERLAKLDSGQDAHVPVARVVASDGELRGKGLDLAALTAHTGATEKEVAELVRAGLVTPDAHGRFRPSALRTGELALAVNRKGIPLRNLRAVRRAADLEADAIDQAVQHTRSRSTARAEDAASELAEALSDLHAVLLHRAVASLG